MATVVYTLPGYRDAVIMALRSEGMENDVRVNPWLPSEHPIVIMDDGEWSPSSLPFTPPQEPKPIDMRVRDVLKRVFSPQVQ